MYFAIIYRKYFLKEEIKIRFFNYWVKVKYQIKFNNEIKEITCFGHSDISEEDAVLNSKKSFQCVKNKIENNSVADTDYSEIIKEEIIEKIDDNNIITRNKMGCLVLNTTSLIILDIDDCKLSFLETLGFKKYNKKEKILQVLEGINPRIDGSMYGIRIYETYNGFRVIFVGDYLEPNCKEIVKLMRKTNTDYLYRTLSWKQKCYRARLTPKPQRIKIKPNKLRYPYTEDEQSIIDRWVEEYNQKVENYGVCRLVKTIGDFAENNIVQIHDHITCANVEGKEIK